MGLRLTAFGTPPARVVVAPRPIMLAAEHRMTLSSIQSSRNGLIRHILKGVSLAACSDVTANDSLELTPISLVGI